MKLTDKLGIIDVAPRSPAFEACREAVARELRWPTDQVMDWEVRSFMAIKPEKAERIIRAAGRKALQEEEK